MSLSSKAGKQRRVGLLCPDFVCGLNWYSLFLSLSVLSLLAPVQESRAQYPAAQYPASNSDPRVLNPVASSRLRDTEPTLVAPRTFAGPPAGEPSISGMMPALNSVPQRGTSGSEEVARFVENLGTHDGTFEVILGEGRLLTLRDDLTMPGRGRPIVAVGDPTVVDFIVVGPRQLRLVGQRIGTTDFSITTADGRTFSFEVLVVADLNILRAQLKAMFPEATLRLTQVRDSVVAEGEARDTIQVEHILDTIRSYLLSVQVAQSRKISGQNTTSPGRAPGQAAPPQSGPEAPSAPAAPGQTPVGPGGIPLPEQNPINIEAKVLEPRVINLIHVHGPQQVLLKVRVAELNRAAMREIGADWLVIDPESGTILGTQIGGAGVAAMSTLARFTGLTATAVGNTGPTTTAFGVFQEGDFEIFLRALRRNLIMKTLAEPNLVAMNGQQASFLAGGEFPVPIPQVAASGVAPTVTVQFKEFGVRLGFVPYVLDHDVIRLTVDPEVSSIDFSIGTTLVAGGSPVPGLNTRKAHTTVELRQGQTLLIAGLLSLTLDGQTSRIPGLGDLPVLGPFFSNTTNQRQEKELVVMVTPYLIEPLNCDQVPPSPGDEVNEPTDLELYFLNRIEGRTGRDFRSTTHYDDPFHLIHHIDLEKKYVSGPCGFTDQ